VIFVIAAHVTVIGRMNRGLDTKRLKNNPV